MKPRSTLLACALVCAALLGSPAHATTRGKTMEGLDYATGGVTVAELRTLADDRSKYSLWLTTAAKGSGAFLSDARVRITDAGGEVVLDTTLIGPWLFVDLEPGTYRLQASVKDQSQSRTVRVSRDSHRQAVLYFDSPATLSPDWRSPFTESPYASN